jgi:hypothetical protein
MLVVVALCWWPEGADVFSWSWNIRVLRTYHFIIPIPDYCSSVCLFCFVRVVMFAAATDEFVHGKTFLKLKIVMAKTRSVSRHFSFFSCLEKLV